MAGGLGVRLSDSRNGLMDASRIGDLSMPKPNGTSPPRNCHVPSGFGGSRAQDARPGVRNEQDAREKFAHIFALTLPRDSATQSDHRAVTTRPASARPADWLRREVMRIQSIADVEAPAVGCPGRRPAAGAGVSRSELVE